MLFQKGRCRGRVCDGFDQQLDLPKARRVRRGRGSADKK